MIEEKLSLAEPDDAFMISYRGLELGVIAGVNSDGTPYLYLTTPRSSMGGHEIRLAASSKQDHGAFINRKRNIG